MSFIDILIIAGALVLGAIISQAVFRRLKFVDFDKAQKKSEEMLEQSKEEAKTIKEEAAEKAENVKKNTDDTINQMKTLIHTIEQNVKFKEEALDRKERKNDHLRGMAVDFEKQINESEQKYEELEELIKQKLATQSGEKIENLKAALIKRFEKETSQEAAEAISKKVDNARENAEKTAKEILKSSIQKFTDETSVEKKEAKIIVPRDEAKAAIVGRNAENVKLIEELLEIDVVFNDEPNTIVVSTFDLLRKNVARIAVENLVKKRRIKEQDIKQAIKDAKKVIEKDLAKVGEKAVKKMNFKRKFPAELIKIIGRLKYRTSYGQNILLHSFEVASMAELLAGELGLDPEMVKVAAFFHDIGKAIDQHVEGSSHDVLTREIMTKYGCFSQEEIHAAWTHHEAETPETPEARLVMAADAISAGRPGARQESLEKYLERLRALEKIATSYEGVQKTFAISAGRELRVILSPDDIKDEEMDKVAKKIAREIEENLSYPGKIKVNLIRRTRSVDYAK
ncbi:Rnase Y domain-containing protein [Patescibacteria group bacterium]